MNVYDQAENMNNNLEASVESDSPDDSQSERREIWGVVNPKGSDGERRKKGFWTRIGVGFQNKDGSWSLRFEYLPTSAETSIQLRKPRERPWA